MFIDAAGNRMMVDTAATKPVDAATAANAEAVPTMADESSATRAEFNGESYVDAHELQQDLDQRESQRFFVVPDGSGRRQTLEAGAIGAGQPKPLQEESVPAAGWQVCRIIVPLLSEPPSRALRYDLAFPVTDGKRAYGGYLLAAPDQANRMTMWSYVKKASRAFPVLARVDDKGRVLAIVNNMPTQSIPESSFSYGRVGGTVALRAGAAVSGRFALLDGARLQGKIPAECGLQATGDGISGGLVTLQFSDTGGQ